MSEDREVLREIWEGRIPVCISLAEEDVSTTAAGVPELCYLMAPRITYFPLLLDKVQRYLEKFVDPHNAREMWLEYEGQPLKWHIPVGVLFDLHATDCSLPWKLTAHFFGFPESELLHCLNRDAVEAHFMSSVKEADALKHKGQVINSMRKGDHKQLWIGLLTDKFEQFWAINKRLMERPAATASPAGIGAVASAEGFRYIPHRLYRPDCGYVQKLIRPWRSDDTPAMFGDLLEMHATVPSHEAVGGGGAVLSRGSLRSQRALLHGIEVPLDTPLSWLSEHLSHPDNFLHIVLLT